MTYHDQIAAEEYVSEGIWRDLADARAAAKMSDQYRDALILTLFVLPGLERVFDMPRSTGDTMEVTACRAHDDPWCPECWP